MGPIAFVASIVLEPFYLRKSFEVVFGDSLPIGIVLIIYHNVESFEWVNVWRVGLKGEKRVQDFYSELTAKSIIDSWLNLKN